MGSFSDWIVRLTACEPKHDGKLETPETDGQPEIGEATSIRLPVERLIETAVRLAEFEAVADYLIDDGSFHKTYLRLGVWARALLSVCGGYTLDLNGKPSTSGFAVALRQPRLERRTLSILDISAFLERHAGTLQSNGLAFGGWNDVTTNVEMIMATRVFADPRDALRLGLSERQRVVWDLAGNRGIKV